MITGDFQYLYNKNSCEPDPYYLYTIVLNLHNDEYKRGSQVKSLSIITKIPYFKNFKPVLMICLDLYFSNNNFDVVKELYRSLNEKDFSMSHDPSDTAGGGSDLGIVKKILISSILIYP